MPSTPAEPRRASHRGRHGRCGRTRQSRNWPFVETALIAFISISSTVSVDRERRSFVISTRQEMRLQEVRDPLGSVKHRHVSFALIAQYRDGGLTQRAFAQREGIKCVTFSVQDPY